MTFSTTIMTMNYDDDDDDVFVENSKSMKNNAIMTSAMWTTIAIVMMIKTKQIATLLN